MGVLYSGSNPFQAADDEHGAAYLLITGGWIPGMEPPINQLLGLPIHPKSPFVVFTERGTELTRVQFYPRYQELWFLKKP
jgi:hypothetical protein